MKRIRKIVALALATVMMMAMSITAFAAENNTESTVKITNISTREASEVKLYKLASVDFTNNTVTIDNTWAGDAYKADTTDFTALKTKFEAAKANLSAEYTATTSADGKVELKVAPGVYYAAISGSLVEYNAMVIKAYDVTSEGRYEGNTVEIVAKGSTTNTEKTADKGFVEAGEEVNFTINTNIPYEAETFVVFDQPTNLTLKTATVEIAGAPTFTVEFTEVTADSLYKIDLTDYLQYKNAGVKITYVGVVGKNIDEVEDGYGFKNAAYSQVNGEDSTPTPPVIGYTGTIVIEKKGSNNEAVVGATFEVKDSEGNLVPVSQRADGVYVYDVNGTAVVTSDEDGMAVVTGLGVGDYTVNEKTAPQGYTVDTTVYTAKITDTSANNKNCYVELTIVDPDLIQLPFTGGMGTTIFTVLGVAIMAIAAALFFATKRKASK